MSICNWGTLELLTRRLAAAEPQAGAGTGGGTQPPTLDSESLAAQRRPRFSGRCHHRARLGWVCCSAEAQEHDSSLVSLAQWLGLALLIAGSAPAAAALSGPPSGLACPAAASVNGSGPGDGPRSRAARKRGALGRRFPASAAALPDPGRDGVTRAPPATA